MSKLLIDADKVKCVGEELIAIAKEYNNLNNELFTKLNDIVESGAWKSESQSGSANQFISSISSDKLKMNSLSNSITCLGDKVINYANNVNAISDIKI